MRSFIAGIAASLLLAAGLGTAASAQTKVVAGYGSISVQNAPLWIAKEKGFFAKHGLDVEFVRLTGVKITNGLISGDVQFASAGGSLGMLSVNAGSDVLVIGTEIETMTYDLVVKEDIKTFEDLKGRIGIVQQRGDLTGIGMETILAAHGIDADTDVNIVQGGGDSERIAALIAGSADFTVTQPDFRADYEAAGYHRLANAMEIPGTDWLALSYSTTRRFAESNPEAVKSFLKAMGDAMAFLLDNREETIEIIAKAAGRDPEKVAPGYDFYKEVIKRTPVFGPEVIQATVVGLAKVNPDQMKPDADPALFADWTYGQELVKEGYFQN